MARSSWSSLLTALLAWLLLASAAGCNRIHERFITDEQGRALILHGVNVSNDAKDSADNMPWVEPEDVARLAEDWGFNFVRFLIFWSAIEPWADPGAGYDEAYLDKVEQRLDWFADAGIHVALDMHQDVYALRDAEGNLFGFDGAPGWAVRTDGIPHVRISPWFANYLLPAVIRAFDNFFDYQEPHRDLQDRYAAAWRRVAERLGGHPAVLGYDIMNEPFPGREVGDGEAFDTLRLRPFYQRVIDQIRSVDSGGWIFYAPRALGPNGGGPSYIGTLNDPRPGDPRLAYFPHYYSSAVDIGGRYDPEVDKSLVNWELERRKEIAATGEPILIGEFGTTAGTQNGAQYIEDVVRLADRMTSGWAVWVYDTGGGFALLDGEGNEGPFLDVLVRAYPRRIAGEPLFYDFDPQTRELSVIFAQQAGVTGPTEIYLPERVYPQGWTLQTNDSLGAGSSDWDAERNLLSVTSDPRQGIHCIRVRPFPAPGASHPCRRPL